MSRPRFSVPTVVTQCMREALCYFSRYCYTVHEGGPLLFLKVGPLLFRGPLLFLKVGPLLFLKVFFNYFRELRVE